LSGIQIGGTCCGREHCFFVSRSRKIFLASRPFELEKSRMGNVLLERAAHQRPMTTKRGALERLFTLMFKGFVYNQIWEDPAVDLEALKLAPEHRLITIASVDATS